MIKLNKKGHTMKKYTIFIIIFLFSLLFTSCKSETEFISHPIAYGQVDSDSIASMSFDYMSERPNNPNSFMLSVYALPHQWAEVNVDEDFDPDNPNIEKLVDGYLVRYYAKYILVGNDFYQLVIDPNTNPKGVSYQNDEGIDILDLMITEEACKKYIEEVELNNVYIVTEERLPYNEYQSVLITEQSSHPIVIRRTGLQISYVGENETMPEIWKQFMGYDRDLINELFNRALAKAFDPEYKTSEYK
jgi:hypothetical protein